MGNDDDERAAKQSRWGSLASRLEVQCEDVLTMEVEDKSSATAGGAPSPIPVTATPGAGAGGSSGSNNGKRLDRTNSQSGGVGNVTSSSSPLPASSHNQMGMPNNVGWGEVGQQLQLQPNDLMAGMPPQTNNNNNINTNHNQGDHNEALLQQSLEPLPLNTAPDINISTNTNIAISSLKDWIVTKKVDKEIKEATSTLPPPSSSSSSSQYPNGMSPYEKSRIEKCAKVAYLLVGQLAKSFDKTAADDEEKQQQQQTKTSTAAAAAAAANSSTTANSFDGESTDWEPKPKDITEDCITITENTDTGEIVDVGFDIYRNFDWDQTDETEEDDDDDDGDDVDDTDMDDLFADTYDTITSPLQQPNPRDVKMSGIFEALGKLLFGLFMEGEDLPTNYSLPTNGFGGSISTTNNTIANNNNNISNNNNSGNNNIGGGTVPSEDDILQLLREMPKITQGGSCSNDVITDTMRINGNLPMPLCRLVTDIFYTVHVLKNKQNQNQNQQWQQRGGASSSATAAGNNEEASFCFTSLSDVQSDIQQMIDYPDAFLFASITSRWELVFGNNHMFGRKRELQQLMDAAHCIQEGGGGGGLKTSSSSSSSTNGVLFSKKKKKEAVMVSGHAGSGKSRLVREIRKPLQSQGWLFLRCKFGKTRQAEPLSVIALGLDEYFSSSVVCCGPTTVGGGGGGGGSSSQQDLLRPSTTTSNSTIMCSCANSNCPRKICQRLETLIGQEGLKHLSQQMPSLGSLIGDRYAPSYASSSINGTQYNIHQLFGTLLDTLASLSPVLFFVDDLQWADASSLELLTDLIKHGGVTNTFNENDSTKRILFVGAYRTDIIVDERSLNTMIKEFEECSTISTTQISLHGFQLDSLNEMVSEALCLPRRKTRSLAQIIHIKTQGFPLFVVEFLDALWTEKMLIHNQADGWDWDVDVIDLKGISKSVAELLACKLEMLHPDVLSCMQVFSCFGSHVDIDVLDAVKYYDGTSDTSMMAFLETAQREGLVEKAGPTFAFTHHLIQQAAFDLIPTANRVQLLEKLVSCLIPQCTQGGGSDALLFVTVDLISKIGKDAVANNLVQSQLFARLNLEAGRKSMAENDFTSAIKHFNSGITFLSANHWQNQYDLSLSLYESAANANYGGGDHEQVVIQANQVLSNARTFEDKFKSYCVFIHVIALSSFDKAAEKVYDLLRQLGENLGDIDPNAINPQVALAEFVSTRELLAGTKKDTFLHHFQMTDRTKLMCMKLMSMLVLYYNRQTTVMSNRQTTVMSGYLSCRMIRISVQFGHCEDTVFALATFSAALMNQLLDIDESYALGRTTLSLLNFYNTEHLIPRVYGIIYGSVFVSKDPLHSLLDPLLKACRLSFSNGYYEYSFFNTMIYIARSWHAGKKIQMIFDEVNAFAHKHKQHSHMNILQLFLAPTYKTLSALSGITLDSSELLPQLAASVGDDIIETAKAKNEMLFFFSAIRTTITDAVHLRDFAKASQVILKYPAFFENLLGRMSISSFEIIFLTGLVSFHMARETRESHWMEKGETVLSAFEKWSVLNKWNFEHRYQLLKAECHHTKGETNAAIQAYDLSAEAAQKHHCIPQVAVACELAAHYFGNIGIKDRTREMIQRSHDAYLEWGANRKAKTVIGLLELNWLDGSV